MAITTKRGDDGFTDLYAGLRVRKDDLRIEVVGLVDELSSFLGLGKSTLTVRSVKLLVTSVQNDLFMLGAEVAVGPRGKLTMRIARNDIVRLEKQSAHLEKNNIWRGFILPGDNFTSSIFDLARAISRRLERRLVTLKRKRLFNNADALVYCNRLSDLLYLLARSYEKKTLKIKRGREASC